jgi:predicted GNAT family acetyltransferase
MRRYRPRSDRRHSQACQRRGEPGSDARLARARGCATGSVLERRRLAPPRARRSTARQATGTEQDLLTGWEQAFAVEAGVAVSSEAEDIVNRRLAQGAQFVWDYEGPVAMLAMSPAIAGTVRIGPVYTPPEHRRHGYASSAVAAASRRALANGARQCMLFTDLANPTSNQIYAAVGYRRCGDWEEYAFIAPG